MLASFIRGGGGDHKQKIMDRSFMPKYDTVSQVLLQLVVAHELSPNKSKKLLGKYYKNFSILTSLAVLVWVGPLFGAACLLVAP